MNCEYSEKLQDLDLQVKIQKDELRKKDSEIMELTNEAMKSSNDHGKKQALVEQERDFLRNDLNHLKENLQRKEMDLAELIKQNREKEEKIKSYRGKKKQAEKEVQEIKSQKDKIEHQMMNMQPISQAQNSVDSQQHEILRKELDNVKLEKIYLQNQLMTI